MNFEQRDRSYHVVLTAGQIVELTDDVEAYGVAIPRRTRLRVSSVTNAGFRGIEVFGRVLDADIAEALTTASRRVALSAELGIAPTPDITVSAGVVSAVPR